MQLWEDKGNKKARVAQLELGEGRGSRKKGEHSIMRQHTSMGGRALNPQTEEKKSQLHQELQQVRDKFRSWRMAGLYLDRDDLILEFENKLKKTAAELEAKKSKGGLSPKDLKKLYWVQRRLKKSVRV